MAEATLLALNSQIADETPNCFQVKILCSYYKRRNNIVIILHIMSHQRHKYILNILILSTFRALIIFIKYINNDSVNVSTEIFNIME